MSGLRYSPRIKDLARNPGDVPSPMASLALADQKLYRISDINLDSYPQLKEHIQGIINQELKG